MTATSRLDRHLLNTTGECRKCGLTVLWVTGELGKRFPANPLPDPAGTFAITRDRSGELFERPAAEGRHLYTEHDTTCKGAAQ
jgi:hypothetical protein